jgi:hypothetical protein
MVGTGWFQEYLWALVCGEPEFDGLGAERPDERPERQREALQRALTRLFADEEHFANRLWQEMAFLEELDSQLMRLHAYGACEQDAPSDLARVWAREYVAVNHGYPDWRSLQSDVVEGRLYGAIPFTWITEAVTQLAGSQSQGADPSATKSA